MPCKISCVVHDPTYFKVKLEETLCPWRLSLISVLDSVSLLLALFLPPILLHLSYFHEIINLCYIFLPHNNLLYHKSGLITVTKSPKIIRIKTLCPLSYIVLSQIWKKPYTSDNSLCYRSHCHLKLVMVVGISVLEVIKYLTTLAF